MGTQKESGRRSGEQGFTIMEVLIAMLLFAVMLAGMAAMQVTVLRASTDARVTSIAAELAQSRMEDFRSMAFTSVKAIAMTTPCSILLDPTKPTTCCFTYAGETATCDSAAEFFRRVETITNSGSFCNGTATVSTGAKGIVIQTEWTGQGGSTASGCPAGKTCVRLCMEIAP